MKQDNKCGTKKKPALRPDLNPQALASKSTSNITVFLL